MIIVLKILSFGLLLGGVMLFVSSMYAEITRWWTARLRRYAEWVSVEFEGMFEELPVERAERLITIALIGSFVIGFSLGGGLLQRVFAGAVFTAAGYFGPWFVVTHRRKRRMEIIDDQFVDALHLMSNALKSGLSLQQALELVVREMKPPIADEFGRLVKEIHLGRLTDDALRRFAERLPLDDVQLAVESILTLRETGGNLSETFEVIAHTIVERKKVQGKIKAMTAQGMTQGMVACAMPIFMMLMFSLIDPSFMTPFFTTPLGWMMLALVFVLDALGMWLMFKLVKVNV
jgi:tight adherence protein B